MIAILEATLGKNPEEDVRIQDEMKTLLGHREYVMKNPDALCMQSQSS